MEIRHLYKSNILIYKNIIQLFSQYYKYNIFFIFFYILLKLYISLCLYDHSFTCNNAFIYDA